MKRISCLGCIGICVAFINFTGCGSSSVENSPTPSATALKMDSPGVQELRLKEDVVSFYGVQMAGGTTADAAVNAWLNRFFEDSFGVPPSDLIPYGKPQITGDR